MIVEKILNRASNTPSKEAIHFNGLSINYSTLTEKVKKKIEAFKLEKDVILQRNNDPIETLINVLACNFSKRKIAIVPADFPEKQISKIDTESINNKSFIGILTSGSAGIPKIIWKSNDNWESAFRHQSKVFGISKTDNVFVLNALSYSANLNAALHILWEGGTLVLGDLKQAKNWERQFELLEISSAFLVPSHCRLLKHNISKNSNLNSLVTAGEKLDIETAKTLLDLFPNVLLTEYYGAAELGHITYHQNQDIINCPNSVGKPFPKVDVSIKESQVKVKSPYVSPDYISIATVNDLGYFDNDGSLVLNGRAGRIFNRRALNIYAQEIENIALKLGSIERAVLVENESNKKLSLYFTRKKHVREDLEGELLNYLKEFLPRAKWPNFLKELKEIPHSEAGKIDFKALSKMSEEY